MLKILCVLSIIFFCRCSGKKEEKPEPVPAEKSSSTVQLTAAQLRNAGIETGSAEVRDIQSTLRVTGLVDVPPQNLITVSFPTGGYVKSINMLPGMKIRKGQVLAIMEDQAIIQLQQDYLMAKSRSGLLQKEMARQQLLNTTKASSDKVLEQAASNFELETIALSSLKEKLLLAGINPASLNEGSISRTVNITAPINGYVSAVRVNTGKYVSSTDVLFELINIEDLHLMLNVFEKDLLSVQAGQTVNAFLTGDTAHVYTAKVMLVSRMVDSTRSATVHCHFTGNASSLLPGMFMNATIATNMRSLLTVPAEAVVQSGDQQYVFVQQQAGVFKLVPVKVIGAQNTLVAIETESRDLQQKQIVTKNAYAVLMKLKNTGEEE